MFRFKCTSCDEWHEGMPTFGADAPLYLYGIPAEEGTSRCVLEADTCVVDQEHFFVRGCLEIPVQDETEPFIWGVWISLSRKSSKISLLASTRQSDRTSGPSLARSRPN